VTDLKIPLVAPLIETPFSINDKADMNRPNQQVSKVDNIFYRDRWRHGVENLDIQDNLVLEVEVKPSETASVSVVCFPTEEAWKKEIHVSTDATLLDETRIVIPLTAEVNASYIQFRDNSHEQLAQATATRNKLLKEKVERTSSEFIENKDVFLGIPKARKKMNDAKLAISYKVYLRGNKDDKILLIQTR
ncbi:MAG: hypothetical protein ACRC2T_14575, partial [Thermoguttaceae bacterium]